MAFAISHWLRTLSADELADILAARPDCAESQPRSLRELGERLSSQASVRSALLNLDLGAHDALALVITLGDGCDPLAVADMLGAGTDAPELDRALRELHRNALVWPTPEGKLRLVGPLRNSSGVLQLGRSGHELFALSTVDELTRVVRELGIDAPKRKADLVAGIVEFFSDPEQVRALLAAAPKPARQLAGLMAWETPTSELLGFGPPEPGVEWLRAHGFVVAVQPAYKGGLCEMPREVALAVRGPDYRPPLHPQPEPPETSTVDASEVDRCASVAAGTFVDGVTRLLDHCAERPLPKLRNTGGVGVRALQQTAKALRSTPADVRLWLEVAARAGLLAVNSEGHIVPAEPAESWLAASPPEQLVPLLCAWWSLPFTPSIAAQAEKPEPALAGPADPADQALRHDLLAELARHPRGVAITARVDVGELLTWRRPAFHPEHNGRYVELTWEESETLGVTALNSLSTLGVHLHHADSEALLAAAREMLPRAVETAVLQADLTAVVTGPPSARLRSMLDRAADVEDRDAASTWRFSPSSVRRALDQGHTADELLQQLEEISVSEIPQPLRYLVRDVARRFGELAVVPVTCCVVAEESLVRELSAAKSLRELRPRVLAPTVLASDQPPERVVALLRKAGYFPVKKDLDGTVLVERGTNHASESQRFQVYRFMPDTLQRRQVDRDELREYAAKLLAGVDGEPELSATEQAMAGMASQLSAAEVRLLADALDNKGTVVIDYLDQYNRATTRPITPVEHHYTWLTSWCHLREDTRDFRLDRIVAVAATTDATGLVDPR